MPMYGGEENEMTKKSIFAIILTAVMVMSVNVSVFADALSDWQEAQAQVAVITQQIQANTALNPQFAVTPTGQQLKAQLTAAQQKANALFPQALAIAQASTQTTAAPAAPAVPETTVSSPGYIRLADGAVITPGGKLTLAQLQTAAFVNNTSSTLWYAGIASPGIYRVADDDPNWAYESRVGAGQTIPLGGYIGMFNSYPSYNCLTIELASSPGANPKEYSFFVR